MDKLRKILFLLTLWIGIYSPVAGQSEFSVTGIALDTAELTLNVGDAYTFTVEITPADAPFPVLGWFVTDPDVAEVDAGTNTVTAKQPGDVYLYAEGFDRQASAFCHLVVEGDIVQKAISLDTADVVAKDLGLTDTDLNKIQDPGLKDFLTFLNDLPGDASLTPAAQDRIYKVIFLVRPGTEDYLADYGLGLGMTDATPLPNVQRVAVQGTLAQVSDLLRQNDDILAVETDALSFYPQAVAKYLSCTPLSEGADRLTQVKIAHDKGLDGSGSTIVILDTGVDSTHPDLKNHVVAEHCYSTQGSFGEYDVQPVCTGKTREHDSSLPAGAVIPSVFQHGTHVAGIAAGDNGVAPGADLVAVQIFSEFVADPVTKTCEDWGWGADQDACKDACTWDGIFENGRCTRCEKGSLSKDTGKCYLAMSMTSDQYKGFEYVLNLEKQKGIHPDIVNMSFGDAKYDVNCDSEYPEDTNYFARFIQNGILPVVSTGNAGNDDGVCSPACISHSMAIGALAADTPARAASYSNYGARADLLAPGTVICSANYPWTEDDLYRYGSGTSMAAPYAAGAMALLRQNFPNNKVEDLKAFYPGISTKSVNQRLLASGSTNSLSPARPALDFTNFAPYVLTAPTVNTAVYTKENKIEIENQGMACNATEAVDGFRYEIRDGNGELVYGEDVFTPCNNATPVTWSRVAQGFTPAQGTKVMVYKYVNVEGVNFYSPAAAHDVEIEPPEEDTPTPTATSTSTSTAAATATNTPLPTNTTAPGNPTNTPLPTNTTAPVVPTNTTVPVVPTDTAAPAVPTDTTVPPSPTDTVVPPVPTNTNVPAVPTDTTVPVIPTDTIVPAQPTHTTVPVIPTDTAAPVIPTNTAIPMMPTDTLVPPRYPMDLLAVDPRLSYESFFYMTEEEVTQMFGSAGVLPGTGISGHGVGALTARPRELIYGDTDLTLLIPGLYVETPIVTVPKMDGEFPVEWLDSYVGLLDGSAVPGEGVSILSAHNHLNEIEAGPFAGIHALMPGDRIFVRDEHENLLPYTVYHNQKTPAENITLIGELARENALVLITCEDETTDGRYRNRRLIFAEPIG